MATYTQLYQEDIEQITKQYNLDIESFSSIDGGAGNSSYRLKSKERDFVLTVFDEKSYEEVIDLGELLLLLEKYRVPTTRTIPMIDGTIIAKHRAKPVMIKEYIVGEVYENIDRKMLIELGRNLAKIHQIPPPEYLPKKHSYGLESFSSLITVAIDIPYETWLKREFETLQQNIGDELPKALIHGDLFYDNVLFLDKEFQAIIDFEEACIYYRIFDIGMAIIGLCSHEKNIDLDRVQALIAGYQEINKLELIEKESLQVFTAYAATATSSWRFWKYNINLPKSDKSHKHWEMAKLSQKINMIDKEKFMQRVFVL
jgi:homoserine kinase type II